MLISITAISKIWQLKRFPTLPCQIMLDSGSYTSIANQQPLPKPKEVFKRQLTIIADTDIPTCICAVDRPVLEKCPTLTGWNQAIEKTIANAWELRTLMAEYYKNSASGKGRSHQIEPLAIVQGYDKASLVYCAKELLQLGYRRFGIGSMAHLYDTKEIVKRVDIVQSIVGASIHVFGVSAIKTMKFLNEMEIASVDSARPIKAAIYNEILYSDPYRRFGIAGSHFQPDVPKFGSYRLLDQLSIQCPCPVCKQTINNDILRLGVRKYLILRAIHNYYHVKKMISGWSVENIVEKCLT